MTGTSEAIYQAFPYRRSGTDDDPKLMQQNLNGPGSVVLVKQ